MREAKLILIHLVLFILQILVAWEQSQGKQGELPYTVFVLVQRTTLKEQRSLDKVYKF